MLAILLFVALAVVANAAGEVFDFSSSHIGLGVQRLKHYDSKGGLHHGGKLQAANCENVTAHHFTGAIIDNFTPVEHQQKWVGRGQRYWLNKQFWGGPGYPMIVYIGGEWVESCARLTDSTFVFDLARQYNAILVNVEHRFYGESIPTADTSTRNLQYLSSMQALADLARIIGHVKDNLHTRHSPVVTVGGSYPGNLAAWFRTKYPSVTKGSIASSAPLIAQTNFPEYMEVVGQAIIHFSGQKCYNAIESAAETIADLALQGFGSAGMMKLQTDFKTCKPMNNHLDLAVLLSDMMGNVQGTVQYNNEKNGVMNVTDICATMTATSDNYENFVKLQAQYRQANGQECEDASWEASVQYLKQTGASRSWTYQTCNEFGYFQTTDSPNQPFHSWKWLNLGLYKAWCAAAFDGWKSEPQVEWMNEYYGDIHIAGSNIALSSGTIDPWHALGVTNVTAPLPEKSAVKIFIEGTSHCHDLKAPSHTDPPSLVHAREVITELVGKWLHH